MQYLFTSTSSERPLYEGERPRRFHTREMGSSFRWVAPCHYSTMNKLAPHKYVTPSAAARRDAYIDTALISLGILTGCIVAATQRRPITIVTAPRANTSWDHVMGRKFMTQQQRPTCIMLTGSRYGLRRASCHLSSLLLAISSGLSDTLRSSTAVPSSRLRIQRRNTRHWQARSDSACKHDNAYLFPCLECV